MESQEVDKIISLAKILRTDILNYEISDIVAFLNHINEIVTVSESDSLIDKIFKLYLSSNNSKQFYKIIDSLHLNHLSPLLNSSEARQFAKDIIYYFKASDKDLTLYAKAKYYAENAKRDYTLVQIKELLLDFEGFDIPNGHLRHQKYVWHRDEIHCNLDEFETRFNQLKSIILP